MSNIDGEIAAMQASVLALVTPEREAEREARRKADEERWRKDQERERRRRLVSDGVPLRALIALESRHDTQALQEAHDFLEGDAQILVLAGTRGTGKTVAASWLCVERGGVFLDVSRLARVNRYDEASMRPLETCPLLVVDDLGQEFSDAKGSFAATFDGLVNARYGSMLQTVITTNLTAAVFRERYGERVADRIRECGRFVELTGESMRSRA